MEIKIVFAVKKDIKRIFEIFKLAFSDTFNDTTELALIKKKIPKKKIMVALLDNKVVGAISFEFEDGCCEIEDLAILKQFREQGIGKKLVIALEKYAKEKKSHKLWCYSSVKRKASGFYKKLGFKQEGYLKQQWKKRDFYVLGKVL